MRGLKRYLSLMLAIALILSGTFLFPVHASPNLSITVDWNDNRGNNMEGIGGSYAFSKGNAFLQTAEFAPEVTAYLINLIYDSENGAGQTIVRSIVGDGGVRSIGSAARPGYNPINGLRADGANPGFDIGGNPIPISTRIYANSTAARNDTGLSADPVSGVTLADPEKPGFATDGTALYGTYGYTVNDWGNRHFDGGSDTVWPNEGKYDDEGKLVSGYGFVWDLPQWNQPVPGDTGGFTNNFTGKGEVEIVDRPRTMKELFDVDQVWVMKQAQSYGVDTFYSCAWTPPYWMKTSMSIFGQDQGSSDYLRAEVDENGRKIYYQAYADYLAAYVYGYWKEFGVPITHIGPYNESEATHGYSGFRARNADEVQSLVNDYILPTFAKKFGEDGLYRGAPSPEGKPLDWMPELIIGDGTNLNASFQNANFTGPYFKNPENYGKVTASTHFYGSAPNNVNTRTISGSPGATPLTVTPDTGNYPEALRNYTIWETEYATQGDSLGGSANRKVYNETIDDAIRWAYLISNSFNSDPGFSAFMHWWALASNTTYGGVLIRMLSTGTDQNVSGSSLTGAYLVFKRFYIYGHFSRFTETGDVHIGSTTELSSYLNSVAFRHPDGSDFSVTLTNADYEAKTVDVTLQNFSGYTRNLDSVTVFRTSDSENMKKLGTIPVSDGKLTIELPAQSVVTLVPSNGEYATYNGLDGERDPYSSMEASNSDDVMGTPAKTTGENGFPAVSMKNGDTLIYKNVNFADGSINGSNVRRHLMYLMANIESASNGGILRAYVSEPGAIVTDPASQAAYVGEIIIPKGTSSPKLAGITGRQTTGTRSTRIDTGDLGAYMCKDLYLVASGEDKTDLFTISSLRFDADDNGTNITNDTPPGGNVTTPTRPEVAGVLDNGDFESTTVNSNAANPNTDNWESVDCTLTATTAQSYSGLSSALNSSYAYSGMLSGRSANSGIRQDITNKVTAGEVYTFRGMFMPTVDGATAKAEIVYMKDNIEIGRQTIAERSGLDLLPERESGILHREPGTAAGSYGDLYIPIAGIPMNSTAANPTKFRPSGWYEVINTFTYEPLDGAETVMLVLSDDTSADMYIDEVSLVSTPDRDRLLSILNTPDSDGDLTALKNNARGLYTDASVTQAQINALLTGYADYDVVGLTGEWTGTYEVTLTWESLGSKAVLLVDRAEHAGWSSSAASPYVIKGLSPGIHTFTIGSTTITVGMGTDIELPALKITSDKNIVSKGDYFNISAEFSEDVSTNALVVTYTYDDSKFDYRGFTPDGGLSVVNTVKGNGSISFILAGLNGYETKKLGNAMFSAKDNADLKKEDATVTVNVECAYKNEAGIKTVQRASGYVGFSTSDGKDSEITLIDLSNLIDLFGTKSGDPKWAEAKYYDYNNNGEIDIQDISTLASKIK